MFAARIYPTGLRVHAAREPRGPIFDENGHLVICMHLFLQEHFICMHVLLWYSDSMQAETRVGRCRVNLFFEPFGM